MNQTELHKTENFVLTCKSNLYIFIYPVTLSGQMRAKVTHSDVGPLCFAFCYFYGTVGKSKIHTLSDLRHIMVIFEIFRPKYPHE